MSDYGSCYRHSWKSDMTTNAACPECAEERLQQVIRLQSLEANQAAEIERLRARIEELEDALRELIECGDLRGDTSLPHPADDPVTWTARMQDAWDDARSVIGGEDE